MRLRKLRSDVLIARVGRLVLATALASVLVLPVQSMAAVPPDRNDPSNPPELAAMPETGTFLPSDTKDYFRTGVSEGQYLILDAVGDPDTYDSLDMALYQGISATGTVSVFDELAVSRSTKAEEYISWLVPPGADGDYTIELQRNYPTTSDSDWTLDWSLDSTMTPRLWGTTRYETSYSISRSTFATATTAVIASGADFPDALAASGLAGVVEGPVLLTKPTSASASLERELVRLGVTKIYVIGGTSAVSDAVYNQLSAVGSVASAKRLYGSNRYETAKKVAEEIWLRSGTPSDMDNAFVVRGDNFADALAISPFAYHEGIPVLLTKPGVLSGHTYNFIDSKKVQDVTVVGGESAVSKDVYEDLEGVVQDDVRRWYGDNRYATAAVCAENGVTLGWASWQNVGIATGQSFPDALAGGVSCGAYGGPLLLTRSATLSPECHDTIQAHGSAVWMELIFGGEAALSEGVVQEAGGLPY